MSTPPQEPQFDTTRSRAIEQLLFDTVESTPLRGQRTIRRPSARVTVAAIAAFALAGALTGGAVATAAAPNPQQLEINAAVQAAGVSWTADEDSRLIGEPFTASGTGTVVIDLGHRPASANAIVEGSVCTDPGTFNEGIDGAMTSQTVCDSSDTGAGNPGSSDYNVTDNGSHRFTFSTTPGARFTVWLSWIYYPTLSPSIVEKTAIADGAVSRAEYLAAFNQYAGCMAAAGYPMGEVDQSAPVIQYTTTDAAVSSGADNRCYQTQFRAVDELWQTEDGGINKK